MRFAWRSWSQDAAVVAANPWGDRPGHPQHDHDFLELVTITGGSGVHRTASGAAPLSRGDLLLMRPGVWHAYERGRGLAGWDCIIDPGVPGRELAWTIDDPDLGRLLWSAPARAGGALHLHLGEADVAAAERLLGDLRRSGGGRARRLGLLLQLLAVAARALPPASEARPAHPAVAAALRLIEQDPALPWTLSGLALRLHLRPGYLARIFRRATGLPPLAYVHRRRAEMAAALLARTALPVAEVGARVGWSDANLFARRFKALLGVPPSRWRERSAAAQPANTAIDTGIRPVAK